MRIAIVDDIKEERAVLYGWLSNQLSKRNIPGDSVKISLPNFVQDVKSLRFWIFI